MSLSKLRINPESSPKAARPLKGALGVNVTLEIGQDFTVTRAFKHHLLKHLNQAKITPKDQEQMLELSEATAHIFGHFELEKPPRLK